MVIVQDLMDAQIIPADTDFRMFSYRYYGSLPGLDVAFLLDSSAYHTHEDAPHRLRPGTLQVLACPLPQCGIPDSQQHNRNMSSKWRWGGVQA